MKPQMWNMQILFISLQFICLAFCYPIGKNDQASQKIMNDEKTFDNGTVVGQYSYTDKEGNPIEVKYYAEESSYGVELNSVKLLGSTKKPQQKENDAYEHDISKVNDNLARANDSVAKPWIKNKEQYPEKAESNRKISVDDIQLNYPTIINKYKPFDPYNFLNREIKKGNHSKVEKPQTDYDIYTQNELKGDNNCGNEKVKLYLNEPNRNIRSALDSFNADKYCERIFI